MKKLSICIPTWNRCNFIVGLLNNIAEQSTDKICDEIEICISDNASNDDTGAVVESFMEQHKKLSIRYSCNDYNIFELNFFRVVEMACGEYCWIIGDDDLVAPGGLHRILHELNNNADIGMIITSNDRYNATMDTKIETVRILNNCCSDRLFDFSKREELLEYLRGCTGSCSIFGLLSNVIFKKEQWSDEKKLKIAKSLNGTCYSFIYMHLETIFSGIKFLYIYDSIILYRRNNFRDITKDTLIHNYISTRGFVKVVQNTSADEQLKKIIFKIMQYDHGVEFFQLLLLLPEEDVFKNIDRFYSYCGKELLPQIAASIEEMKSISVSEFLLSLYGKSENRVDEVEHFLQNKDIVIFGAGTAGETICRYLLNKSFCLVGFSDNNKNLWGTKINGLPVIPPSEIPINDNTAILITFLSGYNEEKEKLHKLGHKNVICFNKGE